MNNSLKQACQHCINQSEKSINELQILIAKCVGSDLQECAREIGKTTAQVTQSINACNACMAECNSALAQETDRKKKQMLVNCIEVCKECVEECNELVRSCKSGDEKCVSKAEDSIMALKATIAECKKMS